MLLLNFSPLTAPQLTPLAALTGQKTERVVEVQTQFDYAADFASQVAAAVGQGVMPQMASRQCECPAEAP